MKKTSCCLFAVAALALTALPTATANTGSSRPHDVAPRLHSLIGTVTVPDPSVPSCVDTFAWVNASTGKFTCSGGDIFGGSMVGPTTWTLTGKFADPTDPLGSSFTSHLTEVFTGRIGGRHGTLTFAERFWQEGSPPFGSGAFQVRGKIIHSSGELAGSHGSVIWAGRTDTPDSGKGTYVGFIRQHGRHKH